MRSSAASQLAGMSWPVDDRTSGVVSRSGCARVAAADHPLTQRPPLFTGNLAFPNTSGDCGGPPTSIPHCSAQYGQCVAIVRLGVRFGVATDMSVGCPRVRSHALHV